MKKQLLTILALVPLCASAQFFENFDSSTSIPTGWTVINGGGSSTFIVAAGAPGSSFSSPNAVQINYDSAAHDDYLVTPSINVQAGVNDRLTYYVKNQDVNYVENYDVRVSTTTPTAAAFTTFLKANAPAPSAWTRVNLDLSAYVGQTIYIGFHATSADKFRLLFDDIATDTAPTVVPDCATLTYPANGATDITPNGDIIKWTAPSTGGVVESYDLYLDTNPNPTTLAPVSGTASAKFENLQGNTTYYWKIVPKNAAGSAGGCEVRSFTTKADLTPYCYSGLQFGANTYPITSVSMNGMVNTSSEDLTIVFPRENFVDKNIDVEQGKTYAITFKSNTGGTFTDRFLVFADWNKDGDFADTGETYFGSSATQVTISTSTGIDAKTATGNIAVPATATLGKTRLRVKKNQTTTAYLSPCFSSGATAGATTGLSGTGQSEDYSITVHAPGALAAVEASKVGISVYPNPVIDVLSINSDNMKVLSLQVYSAEGKLLKSAISSETKLNVSDLMPGLYMVKVKTSDNTERTFKVIKK